MVQTKCSKPFGNTRSDMMDYEPQNQPQSSPQGQQNTQPPNSAGNGIAPQGHDQPNTPAWLKPVGIAAGLYVLYKIFG